ncbi:MAG: hypothetical protein IJB24_07115 [Clostridia bacterium]|nr:hypothetical protein [Clostridia bacterium]
MKKIIALLMVAAMLVCICACESKKAETPVETDEIAETGESTDNSTDYYKTDVETNEVETPYGNLSYPAEWVGNVDVTTAEDGGSFIVIFKAKYGDTVVPLYDIVFGASEIGFKLGDLDFEGTNVEVFCDDYTLEGMEQVPEEFSEDYSIKCEDLNVIVSHLVYDHGMTIN